MQGGNWQDLLRIFDYLSSVFLGYAGDDRKSTTILQIIKYLYDFLRPTKARRSGPSSGDEMKDLSDTYIEFIMIKTLWRAQLKSKGESVDSTFLLFLALAALVIILLLLLGLFLLPRLMKGLGGRGGGWSSLAEAFPALYTPEGALSVRQTIQVRRVVYKRCATVGITPQGLYLEVKIPFFSRLKPVLIPWDRIQGVKEESLHWKKTAVLSIGQPEIGTVSLFLDLFAQARPYLDPGLLSPTS